MKALITKTQKAALMALLKRFKDDFDIEISFRPVAGKAGFIMAAVRVTVFGIEVFYREKMIRRWDV